MRKLLPLFLCCIMILGGCNDSDTPVEPEHPAPSRTPAISPENSSPDPEPEFNLEDWLADGITVEAAMPLEDSAYTPQLVWMEDDAIFVGLDSSSLLWNPATGETTTLRQTGIIWQALQEGEVWKLFSNVGTMVYTYNPADQTIDIFKYPYTEGEYGQVISPSLSKLAYHTDQGIYIRDLATEEQYLAIPWEIDHDSPDCPDYSPYPYFFTRDDKYLVFQMHSVGMGGPEGGGGGFLNLETGEWRVLEAVGGNTIQNWVPGRNMFFATVYEMYPPHNHVTSILYDIDTDTFTDLPFKTIIDEINVVPSQDLLQPVIFVHTMVYEEYTTTDFGASLYDIPTGKSLSLLSHCPQELYLLAISPDRSRVAIYHSDSDAIYILRLENEF